MGLRYRDLIFGDLPPRDPAELRSPSKKEGTLMHHTKNGNAPETPIRSYMRKG